MGCSKTIACLDCKKLYYLGYGSYGSWISADTVAAFDAQARKVVGRDSDDPWTQEGHLKKNQNLRTVLVEHEGHRLRAWIDDYEYGTEGDTLYGMGSYGSRGSPILEGVSQYEQINLWDDPPAREGGQ